MSLNFGTSGLRGLVSDMTPEAVARYASAFLVSCDCGGLICVGRDLRPSSARIARNVTQAARALGMRVVECGAVPTPALALAAQEHGGGAIMVTGSHIPADRNGLKFYSRAGEITKADEVSILANLTKDHLEAAPTKGAVQTDPEVEARYVARYVRAFGTEALTGRRIGLYAHSSVGRDLLTDILTGIGAKVIPLGRSETFIPVDTEAVDPQSRRRIARWVSEHRLDALVSTDGDADRPLLADETGVIVPGDILGQITAETLRADVVVTPISSNSGVMQKRFDRVVLTRIGSPYVIAAMEALPGAVVGYEANGGFLLGFAAQGPVGTLASLMTRDCTLPLLAVLYAARRAGVAARVAEEPPVITRAGRLQEISPQRSSSLLARLTEESAARGDFLAGLGECECDLNVTDGLRMTLESGATLHLRPSGNAPELRVYVEGHNAQAADALRDAALRHLTEMLRE